MVVAVEGAHAWGTVAVGRVSVLAGSERTCASVLTTEPGAEPQPARAASPHAVAATPTHCRQVLAPKRTEIVLLRASCSDAMMASVDEIEVVVAHSERATLRVGQAYLKIDADQDRADREVEAIALAPVPTPEILWRKPPVLALGALPGAPLGRLGYASPASSAAWAAAGAALKMLHDAPLPRWSGTSNEMLASRLEEESAWLVDARILPADIVHHNHRAAQSMLRPWTPVFVHGDLQPAHVFVAGDDVSGIIDWSEAGQGDAGADLAVLTFGHEDRLSDVATGYGAAIDVERIRSWWSFRGLTVIRWLVEHGYDPTLPGREIDVLRGLHQSAKRH